MLIAVMSFGIKKCYRDYGDVQFLTRHVHGLNTHESNCSNARSSENGFKQSSTVPFAGFVPVPLDNATAMDEGRGSARSSDVV